MKTRASVLGLFAVLAAFAHIGAAEPAEAGVASAVAVNRAPWLRPIGDRVVPVRERIVIVPRAGDPDHGPRQLTFRASGRPGWLAINVSTGVLSGTPPRAAAGTSHRVTVIARDGAARASRTFLLRVFNARPNLRPIADRTVIAGLPLSVRLRASDADRAPQPLRFSKVFGPRWLTVDSAQRTIAGTPRLAAAGTTVRAAVRASDGKKSMRRTFVVTIVASEVPNTSPTIDAIADVAGSEGVLLDDRVITATDADGDAVAITSDLDVEGLSFTDNGAGSATLTGTPAAGTAAASPYTVTVRADDGNETMSESFQITVVDPNAPCWPISTEPCATVEVSLPYDITFDGTEGGLDGTGFTMVDAPSQRDIVNQLPAPAAPTDAGVPGFEPSLLDVSGGNLTINATKGIQYLIPSASPGTNSQINALGVGVSNAHTGYRLETTVVAPTYPGTDNMSQQGGLWFGLDEDNYVKLVALRVSATEYKVQLLGEIGGVVTSSTHELTSAVGNANDVRLVLHVQDTSGTGANGGVARAYYSRGGAPLENLRDPTKLGLTQMPIPQTFFDGRALPGDTVSFAGVFATKRDAPADEQLDVTFADFSVRDLAG